MQSQYPQDEGHGGRGYAGPPAANSRYGYRSNSRSPAPFRGDPRRHTNRHASDSSMHMMQGNGYGTGYSSHGRRHQSYESATTASGSGGSYGNEPWGNSTDPSSENSSFDRLHQVGSMPPAKSARSDQYGYSSYDGTPELQQRAIMEDETYQNGYDQGYGQQQYQGNHDGRGQSQYNYYNGSANNASEYPQANDGSAPPPPPPPHHASQSSLPRAPSKLQSARQPLPTPADSHAPQQYDAYGTPISDSDAGSKRKSWLKRRFSKNG